MSAVDPSGTGRFSVSLSGGCADDATILPAGAEMLGHGVPLGAGPAGSPV